MSEMKAESASEIAVVPEPAPYVVNRASWDRFTMRGLDEPRIFGAAGPEGPAWAVAPNPDADVRLLELAHEWGFTVFEYLNPLTEELRDRSWSGEWLLGTHPTFPSWFAERRAIVISITETAEGAAEAVARKLGAAFAREFSPSVLGTCAAGSEVSVYVAIEPQAIAGTELEKLALLFERLAKKLDTDDAKIQTTLPALDQKILAIGSLLPDPTGSIEPVAFSCAQRVERVRLRSLFGEG